MTNMKVNLDGATPMSADDPAEAKFNVALEKAQDDQDRLRMIRTSSCLT
jgi:hypothetical protein